MDKWTELQIMMPSKIIKFGCVAINSSEIIIAGGIYGGENEQQFTYVNTAYKLDLYSNKWTVLPRMNARRVLDSTLPFTPQQNMLGEVVDSKIYAIGGTFDGSCEAFSLNSGKWQ